MLNSFVFLPCCDFYRYYDLQVVLTSQYSWASKDFTIVDIWRLRRSSPRCEGGSQSCCWRCTSLPIISTCLKWCWLICFHNRVLWNLFLFKSFPLHLYIGQCCCSGILSLLLSFHFIDFEDFSHLIKSKNLEEKKRIKKIAFPVLNLCYKNEKTLKFTYWKCLPHKLKSIRICLFFFFWGDKIH